MRFWVVAFIVMVFSPYAYSFNVYKCKDRDGNTVFSQTACLYTKSEYMQVEPATGHDDPDRQSKALTERAALIEKSKQGKYKSSSNNSKVMKSSSSKNPMDSGLCRRYKNKISSLNTKMRSGYSSNEGESYRAKLRSANKNMRKHCK